MAFVSKEKKAKISEALKLVVPKGWRYTLKVQHRSTITMTIREAPIDLVLLAGEEKKSYTDINIYYLEKSFQKDLLETFQKIKDALNTDNYDRSDPQTDYFCVGHYIGIQIGEYDKPFVCSLDKFVA